MMINSSKDFIDFIDVRGAEAATIKAYNNEKGYMHKITFEEIDKFNNLGEDIYFVVNVGGDKDDYINKFNAFFVDIDAGRDSNKKYKTQLEIDIFKQECDELIEGFLKPSVIVETRNGYHLYWKIDEDIDKEEWNKIQNKLVSYFNADIKAKNPARLLRVPFTYWMKDKNNPYKVTIKESNNVVYRVDTIRTEIQKYIKASNISTLADVEKKGIHNKNSTYVSYKNLSLIKASDINGLAPILGSENIIFSSESECRNYITKEIDLAEYLGISNSRSFKCIFHDDNKPSSSIFKGNNGDIIYNCFSDNCGIKGNIIMITAHLQGCSYAKAKKFIMDVYNLKVEETEQLKELKENIDENIRMIIEGELKEYYPDIHSSMWRYAKDLIIIYTYAKENLSICIDDKNTLFFVSQNHLASIIKTMQSKVSVRMALLAFLKLCEKVDDDDVPEEFYMRAKAEALKKNVKDTIQFYRIPSFTIEALQQSDARAKMWLENHCTMKGMSREMIYRTFGEEIADEVYPKRKGIAPTEKSYEFQDKLEKLIMKSINKKGYAIESEILDKMNGWKTINEINAKRVLADSLNKLDLKKVRATKQLKEQLKVKAKKNSYPFIIIEG